MKSVCFASLLALLLCSTASTAFAQIASEGSIRGFIKDEQGAAPAGRKPHRHDGAVAESLYRRQ